MTKPVMRRPSVVRRKPKSINKYGKARLNLMLPAEIFFWIQGYADENKTSMTEIILDHFKALHAKWTAEHSAEQI